MVQFSNTDQASGVFLELYEVLGWRKREKVGSSRGEQPNCGSWCTAGGSRKSGFPAKNYRAVGVRASALGLLVIIQGKLKTVTLLCLRMWQELFQLLCDINSLTLIVYEVEIIAHALQCG